MNGLTGKTAANSDILQLKNELSQDGDLEESKDEDIPLSQWQSFKEETHLSKKAAPRTDLFNAIQEETDNQSETESE